MVPCISVFLFHAWSLGRTTLTHKIIIGSDCALNVLRFASRLLHDDAFWSLSTTKACLAPRIDGRGEEAALLWG